MLDLIIYQLHHEEFKHIEKQRQQILQEHARQTYEDIMNSCPSIGNNVQMDLTWARSSLADANGDENPQAVTKLQVRQVNDPSSLNADADVVEILQEVEEIRDQDEEEQFMHRSRDVLNKVPEMMVPDGPESHSEPHFREADTIQRKVFLVKSSINVDPSEAVMDICPKGTECMMSS